MTNTAAMSRAGLDVPALEARTSKKNSALKRHYKPRSLRPSKRLTGQPF